MDKQTRLNTLMECINNLQHITSGIGPEGTVLRLALRSITQDLIEVKNDLTEEANAF